MLQSERTEKNEIDIDPLELLTELGKYKKLLFGVPLAISIVVALGSGFITPLFIAKTTFLPPPSQTSTASSILDQLGPLAGAANLGVKNSGELYIAFLKSNAVLDFIIEKFHLQERYKLKSLEMTRLTLGGNVEVVTDKLSGFIILKVSDTDPQFAADLANAHLDALRALMGRLAISEAQQRRIFFENQVEKESSKPFRDIKVQEIVLSGLIRQYEAARMDESRDAPLVQQIDKATPPEKKSKPKRLVLTIYSGLIGFLLLAALIFIKWILSKKLNDSEYASKIKILKKVWKTW